MCPVPVTTVHNESLKPCTVARTAPTLILHIILQNGTQNTTMCGTIMQTCSPCSMCRHVLCMPAFLNIQNLSSLLVCFTAATISATRLICSNSSSQVPRSQVCGRSRHRNRHQHRPDAVLPCAGHPPGAGRGCVCHPRPPHMDVQCRGHRRWQVGVQLLSFTVGDSDS